MQTEPSFLDEHRNTWLNDLVRLLCSDRKHLANSTKTDDTNDLHGWLYQLHGRVGFHVASLLTLQHDIHFQASVMIARGIFEIAVDMKLLTSGKIPQSTEKFVAFNRLEVLRAAKKIVAFKRDHPQSDLTSDIQEEAVKEIEAKFPNLQEEHWPNMKKVNHWSSLDLSKRVKLAGYPFDEWHAHFYPLFSWHVHSSGIGISAAKGMQGLAFVVALGSYKQVLIVVLNEFGLSHLLPEIPDVWLPPDT